MSVRGSEAPQGALEAVRVLGGLWGALKTVGDCLRKCFKRLQNPLEKLTDPDHCLL